MLFWNPKAHLHPNKIPPLDTIFSYLYPLYSGNLTACVTLYLDNWGNIQGVRHIQSNLWHYFWFFWHNWHGFWCRKQMNSLCPFPRPAVSVASYLHIVSLTVCKLGKMSFSRKRVLPYDGKILIWKLLVRNESRLKEIWKALPHLLLQRNQIAHAPFPRTVGFRAVVHKRIRGDSNQSAHAN